MSCPFAAFVSNHNSSATSYVKRRHHHLHHHDDLDSVPLTTTTTTITLSQAFKQGTSSVHREIEKSVGARLLLKGDSILFHRRDYIRLLVMLTCVYVTMESRLDLLPKDLANNLSRTKPLLSDITVHLTVLSDEQGESLSDLIESTQDQLNPLSKSLLLELQSILQHSTIDLSLLSILTSSQLKATHQYIKRLVSCQTPILSHIYTRYLGDLNGGQHISRKLISHFPCPCPQYGFQFYQFINPKQLIQSLGCFIDEYPVSDNNQSGLVSEAILSFTLSQRILDSLVDEQDHHHDVDDDENLLLQTKPNNNRSWFWLLPFSMLPFILLGMVSFVNMFR